MKPELSARLQAEGPLGASAPRDVSSTRESMVFTDHSWRQNPVTTSAPLMTCVESGTLAGHRPRC